MFDRGASLWPKSPLGDLIADLRYGTSATCDAAPESGVPVLRIPNIVDGRVDLVDLKYTTPTNGDRERYGVKANDILLVRTNGNPANIGRSALVRADVGPLMYASYLIRIRCKEELILPDFLQAALQSGSTRSSLVKSATTSAGNYNVNAASLRSIEIPLPPLDDQQQIAEVLRSVDEAITANRAIVEQIFRTRAATLQTAFEESSWEAVRLGDLGRWSSGGTPSKADESLWKGDIPWICPRDMKTPVVARAESSVSEKAIGKACKVAPKGTLLLVVRGMILAKAIPTATTAMPATHNQDIKAFHPNGRATPKFVQLSLQHQEHGLLKLVNTATHGTKKLDAQTIAEIEIPLPDLPIQIELANAIADMDLAMVLSGEEHIRLTVMRAALQSDLLSGRVRVPVSLTSAASTRAVQPAFKRAVFAAEVVHQLHRDDRFGSVKHEKIVHLCELHLGLQDDLDRHAYKEAAGPYDPSARRSVERIFRQQKWFNPTKQDNRIVYQPLEASGGHARYFDRYFGSRKAEVQGIIDILRPLTTQQCEIIATLYAVWNDFLIDGRQPSDDDIVHGVLTDWTDSKRQIAEEKWRAALPWMRQRNLIPAGRGEKTRVAMT